MGFKERKAERKAKAAAEADAARKKGNPYLEQRERILDGKAFGKVLTSTNDLAAFVLAFTYLDHLLMYLIDRHLFISGEFYITEDGTRLSRSYSMKVALATAMGEISAKERKLYAAIGSIRNRFAHRLYEQVTERDTEAVLAALRGTYMEKFAREWLLEMTAFVQKHPQIGLTVYQAFVRQCFQKAYDHLFAQFQKPVRETSAQFWSDYAKNIAAAIERVNSASRVDIAEELGAAPP